MAHALSRIGLAVLLVAIFVMPAAAQNTPPHPVLLEAVPENGEVHSVTAGQAQFPSEAAVAPSGPAATIMTQAFEGAWPASYWMLDDFSSSDGGVYLLGKRDCNKLSGTYGGWMTGGGSQGSALPCNGMYPNYLNTWARYGPFNLSTAVSATLTFYYYGDTEYGDSSCPFDYLFVGASTDSQGFSGNYYCGNFRNGTQGNGFYKATYDLSSYLGYSQVWLGFLLRSDGSVTYNGVHLDSIRLDVGESTATISGYVFVDSNDNGTRDAGEAGISGVKISAEMTGQTTKQGTTIASGWYSITNLTPGTYTVTEEQPVGFTSTSSDSAVVSVAQGEQKIVNFGEKLGTVTPTFTPTVTPTWTATATKPPTITPTPSVTLTPRPSDTPTPTPPSQYCQLHEPNNSLFSAYGPLPLGILSSGLCPGDTNDFYSVDLKQGVRVTFKLYNLQQALNADLFLYNGAGFDLERSLRPGQSNEEISYTPPMTGRYYLEVRGVSGWNTQPYRLEYQSAPTTRRVALPLILRMELPVDPCEPNGPNNTLVAATGPLLSGVVYHDALCANDPDDLFYLDVDGPRQLYLRLWDIPKGTDYDLFLLDSSRSILERSILTGNAAEEIRYELPGIGRFYVRVWRDTRAPAMPQQYALRAEY